MKRLIALFCICILVAGMVVPAAALDGDSCFGDITSDSYFYSAVRRAYEWGFMSGTSTSTFEPDRAITRDGFVSGLGRVAGINPNDYAGETGFSDVSAGDTNAPYVLWAYQNGISMGTGSGNFSPNAPLTQQQMVVMTARFLAGYELRISVIEASAELSVLADTEGSDTSKLSLLRQYGVLLDDGSGIDGSQTVTRAETASLLVWLNELLWNGDNPVVNDWTDYTSLEEAAAPAEDNPILSAEAIASVAGEYGFGVTSTAFEALCTINEYSGQISDADRESPLVFLFEGAGGNANPGTRMNAMCVVVWDGEVIYLNRNSSTIPDDPFDPKKNDGMDMPTLCSGIYTYESTNQGYYAALNVKGAQVVRFDGRWDFYESTSSGINIHRRASNDIAPISAYWGNSVGCCLIGVAGTESGGEYARFIQSVGLVPQGSSGDDSYRYMVTGKVVVDRRFGWDYLTNVGYSSDALAMIG